MSRLVSGNGSQNSDGWDEDIDLWAYLTPLLERKWSILGITILALLISFLLANTIKPVYRSTTTLLIAQPLDVVNIKDKVEPGSNDNNYFDTQVEILKSRSLATQVIQKLALNTSPELTTSGPASGLAFSWPHWLPDRWAPDRWPILRDVLASWLSRKVAPPANAATAPDADRENTVIKAFMKRLSIVPLARTQLVKVTFEAASPELAAKVADTLSRIYTDNDRKARLDANLATANVLKERLEDLRVKLDRSEQALQDFRERVGITEKDGTSLARAKLDILNQQLVDAERRATEAEYNYRQVTRPQTSSEDYLLSLPIVQQDPLLQKLLLDRQNQQGDLAKYRKLFGEKHPKIITLQADIQATEQEIKNRLSEIINNMGKTRDAANANLADLKQSVNKAEKEMQNNNRNSFEYERLNREVETNRQLYDLFLKRLKEMEVPIQTANARIVDQASVPTVPYQPNKPRMLLMGGLAGLILGLIWTLFREFVNNSLRHVDDVEARLDVPPLGFLPLLKLRGKERKNGLVPWFYYRDRPRSPFAEGIRTVQTGVIFSSPDEPRKVIVVTSTVPSEGKSTVSMNLALALGRNAKVLLIDADLRQPTLAAACGLQTGTPGLSHYAADQEPLSSCLHRIQGTDVVLMPSGVIPPNPLDLLSSKRFATMLDQLKQRFEYIVIDSPPTLAASDAVMLARLASDVIIVTKANATSYRLVRMAIKQLRKAKAPLTGVVLNQVKARHQMYYGYGYGETDQGTDKALAA